MRERQLGFGLSVTRKLFSHGRFGRSCVFSLEKWILICVVDLDGRGKGGFTHHKLLGSES
jgi:hypothetical protein